MLHFSRGGEGAHPDIDCNVLRPVEVCCTWWHVTLSLPATHLTSGAAPTMSPCFLPLAGCVLTRLVCPRLHPALVCCAPQTEALATAAVRAATKLQAALIVVFTVTGRTARLIAKYRPSQPILTVSFLVALVAQALFLDIACVMHVASQYWCSHCACVDLQHVVYVFLCVCTALWPEAAVCSAPAGLQVLPAAAAAQYPGSHTHLLRHISPLSRSTCSTAC
jgi:hypothetical protein